MIAAFGVRRLVTALGFWENPLNKKAALWTKRMDPNSLRLELIEAICRLSADKLVPTAEYLRRLESASEILPKLLPTEPGNAQSTEPAKQWPHAPLHRLSEQGSYMVTTGTYSKANIFRDPDRLDLLETSLLSLAGKYEWHLEAWAVFSNHYHFVGYTHATPTRLREFLIELHANVAREVNRMDDKPGRKVWHNFWDKQLTFEKSYLARLNYVHQNAVKHGLVRIANEYRWCSAAWFERVAKPAQVATIYRFKTDRLQVADDFEPLRVQ
jgi:putative transposase